MATNVKVIKRDGESDEMLLRRFKREVLRSYVLDEVKKHEFFRSSKEMAQFKHDMLMRHTKNKKYR